MPGCWLCRWRHINHIRPTLLNLQIIHFDLNRSILHRQLRSPDYNIPLLVRHINSSAILLIFICLLNRLVFMRR
ncbi:hypothetical protein NX059_008892 [Plenodomus lindquistii]|nr:hypothetical protein NX059_008892 [Plenodomus lindquistii]